METKKIKIKLSEQSINELLNLQEELGLYDKMTRESRRALLSKEMECYFG